MSAELRRPTCAAWTPLRSAGPALARKVLVALLCLGACKSDPAPRLAAAPKPRAERPPATPVPDASAAIVARVTPAWPPSARFPTLAAFRQQPLFAPFAELVESDDDLDEVESPASSTTAPERGAEDGAGADPETDADADDDDDGPSPDRPPTDVQLTRLQQLPGELYDLSYEENCGDGLEDRRNLHHVLVERRGAELVQLMRYALCGDSRRGFNLDVRHLGPHAPELLVRTFRLDEDGGGEVTLRAFARVGSGFALVGVVEEPSATATRFEVVVDDGIVDVKAVTAGDAGEDVRHRRYALRAEGFVPVASGAARPAPAQPQGRPADGAPHRK